MNQVLDAIITRRSVRSYKPDPIPEDVLERILTAGQYAATGMNRQSPIILAVTDKAVRDELSAMNAAIMGTDKDPFYGAPVVLVVLASKAAPHLCVRRQPGDGQPDAGRPRRGPGQLLDPPGQGGV